MINGRCPYLFPIYSPIYSLKSEISNLKLEAEGISRQLRAWADSLQNSEIKGYRYLNEKEQALVKNKKEKSEFLNMLKSYKK
jgi:hypothetical protein